MLTIAILQGVSVFAAVLAVYLWAVSSARPDEVVRSLTFATLVVGNVALILVNRSWRLPVWRVFRERRNRALTWILLGAGALLAVLLLVPAVRDIFGLSVLAPTDWALALGAGCVGVVWFEIYKAARARRDRRATASL